MVERREWRWVTGVALGLLALAWLPYLAGWAAASPGVHFTGLVYNPLDGYTYIAKMRLGAEGSWLFRLTYTSEPQKGAPIYLFYLFLGHLARWTRLPLLVVYHAVRTVGGLALLFGLYRLAAHLSDGLKERRLLFLLAAMGAGLGWLAAPLGRETPDLWVAEAFPFLALLTNAHFPTALALLVWAAHWGLRADRSSCAGAAMTAAAVALGAIQPFGLVPLLGGLAGAAGVRAVLQRSVPCRFIAWMMLAAAFSLPYPLYTLWAIHADPVLAAWNAQNATPSPSLLEWLLAFGLLAPLAAVGVAVALRRRRGEDGLLLGWALATAVGLALPLTLARRLSLGLGVPVGLLAGMGWWRLRRGQWRASLQVALVGFCVLTPLFLLALGVGAAVGGHPLLYLSDGEWAVLDWLREHVSHEEVVLCAPEMGIFIPAWAGQRVVYGHPFETVEAETRRAQVERFWRGERDPTWLEEMGVEYLFYGPREQALGPPPAGEPLFEAGNAAIYRR